MFVLLQIYPGEAAGPDDETPLDVIAIDSLEAALQRYLAAYEYRYRAAVEDFVAWDDMSEDWGEEYDHMHRALLSEYAVYGCLIEGTKFKIVECLTGGGPFRRNEPEPVLSPASHA